MDRYDNLDLDLECDGGGVAQKAALFGGMFKRSSKSVEPSVQAQDNVSVCSDLSQSSDSLTDSSTKDSGGVFKGMFKKTTKAAKEAPTQDLSASNDSLVDNNKSSKEKSGVFGGILKRSPRLGHARRPSQDLLDDELSASDNGLPENMKDLSASNDSLVDNKSSKEKSGVFGGILKRSPRVGHARRPSQDLLDDELSASDNGLPENTKETGGMFSGMFRKPAKPFGAKTQSQEDLSAPGELSGSSDNLSANTKETSGVFSGMFKKSPKPVSARTPSQDDLSEPSQLSGSSDNLTESNTKEKGGIFSGVFKKPKRLGAKSQSQDDLSVDPELSASSDSLAEKSSKNGFSAMMKSVFHTDKQDSSDTDDEEISDNAKSQADQKQTKQPGATKKLNLFRSANKTEKQTGSEDEDPPASSEKSSSNKQSAVAGAMSKLNPFRSAHKKDTEHAEMLKEAETPVEEKPKMVKSNVIHRERKERSETPLVPPRATDEEVKGAIWYDDVSGSTDVQADKDMTSRQRKDKPAGAPVVPPRRSKEELNRAVRPGQETQRSDQQAPSDDEGLKEEDEPSSKEEKKEEDGSAKAEETKVKKPKRHNPFMPRVKGRVAQKNVQDGAAGNTAENEGGNRSLFDRLEDLRVEPSPPEGSQVEDLMEWWNTVESWEDTPQDEEMTEKEEAKAFAVTAEKVQKGIRVFNKLFSERAESLWQHVIDLNSIADGLDKFNKKTKIAQITGGSTSAIGGVATIAGLALAPVTFGTSLIVTAVGLGVATAGGLTSAGAGISNQVNNSMDRKKVEKIVEDYQEKMVDLNKCLKFIKQGIENLRKFDLIRMKNNAYNRDFPVLSTSFYEDGAMAGKAILINANEIMRVVQIANVAGSTAARAVQIASMATGVLTGLFVGMDIYFVAKDSKELKKGAKSEFAGKIREVATQLHDGLVELNSIREELQSTTQPGNEDDDAALDNKEKKKDEDYDSSEDEIDRIKKAIKQDIENREYV